jgi:hypothetical protein
MDYDRPGERPDGTDKDGLAVATLEYIIGGPKSHSLIGRAFAERGRVVSAADPTTGEGR